MFLLLAAVIGFAALTWDALKIHRGAGDEKGFIEMDDGIPRRLFEDPAISSGFAGLPRRLADQVTHLSVRIGERNVFKPEAYARAAEHIRDELLAMGYAARFEAYRLDRIPLLSELRTDPQAREGLKAQDYRNVVAVKTGRSDEVIVVGAHYDTVRGSPGADDNASGVAVLLEVARLLQGVTLDKTIYLVAFANEEAPFFRTDAMGSARFLKSHAREQKKVALMISLEMLGYYSDAPGAQGYPPLLGFFYPDRADFLAVVGNLASRRWVKAIAQDFREKAGIAVEALSAPRFVPGVDFSDQLNFWKAGIPAVMLTDTAFYRNPNYHSGRDLPHTLDFEKMGAVTQGLFFSLLRIGGPLALNEADFDP